MDLLTYTYHSPQHTSSGIHWLYPRLVQLFQRTGRKQQERLRSYTLPSIKIVRKTFLRKPVKTHREGGGAEFFLAEILIYQFLNYACMHAKLMTPTYDNVICHQNIQK